jgi:hypothetical protein
MEIETTKARLPQPGFFLGTKRDIKAKSCIFYEIHVTSVLSMR